ncbi:MAG: DMP19 family protein [Prevotella sp.]|nr:DMP19 family protein [Prevotella sp.]
MNQITVRDQDLTNAAMQGMEQFVQVFVDAIRQAIGGEPTPETMAQLNADQMTLLCWDTLRQEVMEGGFIQLIHNGYGTFIFKNPFAKALNKMWGLRDLSKMLYQVHTLWLESREALEADCTDEEFMALYEQHPQFDDYDDLFIENEEQWTEQIARYVDNNIEKFATVIP